MMTQELVCGACATAVPYGRLSCPACGELLASVAGGRRVAVGAVTSSGTPAILYDVDDAPTSAVIEGPLALDRAIRTPESELPWGTDGGRDDAVDDRLDGDPWEAPDPFVDDPSVPTTSPVAETTTSADPAPLTTAAAPLTAASPPATTASAAPAPVTAAAAPLTAASPPATTAAVAATPVALTTPATSSVTAASNAPGAYVPPPVAAAMPAGLPAPARAWAGYPPSAEALDGMPKAARATSAATGADGARMAEFVGWLSVAGGALAAVGFLLPWSSISVIGASGVGYFDRWGMAGPGHIVVVLGLLAVLAMAIVRNPVPAWLRVGLPGLGLGALLLGLVWPYLIGPLGASVGVLIVVIGATLLGGAGVLALVGDRHAGAHRAV